MPGATVNRTHAFGKHDMKMTAGLGRGVAALLGAIVTVAATGCTVTGHPIGDYPDPATLDVGAYDIHPLDVPAGNEKYGRIVESARLAEAMIDPIEADAALTFSASPDSLALLPTPEKAVMLLAEPVRPVLERDGLLAGSAVAGTDKEPGGHGPGTGESRVLSVVVLRFPDAATAEHAARDIDIADAAVSPENVAVTIPTYPAAHAHWRPGVPTLAATIAEGAYVISVITGHTSADVAALTDLARKGFDAQSARLRTFSATPGDRIAALSLDEQGMLRRLVPNAPGRWPYPVVIVNPPTREAHWSAVIRAEGVVYGPRAGRMWNGGSAADAVPMELEAVNGLSRLERYRSDAVARTVFQKTRQLFGKKSTKAITPGPDRVPDVFCVEDLHPEGMELARFGCFLLHGRYLAMLLGHDVANLRQRLAAQYGLLLDGDAW